MRMLSTLRPVRAAGLAVSVLACSASALAQCPFIDFENLPVGTTVVGQYPGVKFGGAGAFGCPLGAPIFTIQTIPGATSPTRALATGPNAPCRDGLRIEFDTPQRIARFNATIIIAGTLGSTQNLTVQALDSANAVINTQVLAVPVGWGGTPVGNVFRSVVVTGRQACDIKAIRVVPPDNITIAIDDLRWGEDATPPTVQINSPLFSACVCGNTLKIEGISCDPDGCIYTDKLEYRPVFAAPGTPWTLLGTRSGSTCTPGTLYNVDVSALSGLYYVRLTGTNACGVSDNDITVVNIDRTPPTIDLRCPTADLIVSSPIVFDGTVSDGTSCGESYTVGYRVFGSFGAFLPVNPASVVYTPGVINDPFATWVTASGPAAVSDGAYEVRVQAQDACGNQSTLQRRVIVDNTAPVANITSPIPCRNVCGVVPVIGTASDLNLANWRLEYIGFGGSEASWTTIATGSSNVVNGLLANWDTSSLAACSYVLRLTVDDRANGGCTGRIPNRSVFYRTVAVGAYANCDGSTTPPVLGASDFSCFLNRFRNEGTCPQ